MPKIKKQNLVFLKDKFLPQSEAKICVSEPALLYGWGLFETMRSYNRHIPYLSAHLERLKKSAGLIGMKAPFADGKIKALIAKTVQINALQDARVRLNIWKENRGALICISARPYQGLSAQAYSRGFSACISSVRQNELSILSRIKSTNYLLMRLAYQEAKRRGFDEAIILNSRGDIAECSRSNIFIVKKNALLTPSLDCGCLEGVTRKIVLDLAGSLKIKAYQTKITTQDLVKADGAFITNSLIGIMPLVSLEASKIKRKMSEKVTRALIEKYNRILFNAV